MISAKLLNLAFPIRNLEESAVLVSNSKFIVKLQETRREYMKVQRLRYDVFHREFRKKKWPFGLDRDRYDTGAKHLLVIERESGKIVGSYRAIIAETVEQLYTSSEFMLDQFAAQAGPKLELSRACIHKDFRNGIVLTLLWRGVAELILRSGARYVCGIPSVKSVDPQEIARIYYYYKCEGHVSDEMHVPPHASHMLPGFREALAALETCGEPVDPRTLAIPPLFPVYIKAGAKIVGEPALDREFGCVDFCMTLKMEELTQLFRRKYGVG